MQDRNLKIIDFIIIILAFTSMPLLKAHSIYSAPEGYVYASSTDELTAIAAGNSYLWEYKNPYGYVESNAFSVPLTAGSNYINILFSILFQAVPLDEFLIFYIVTAMFSALLFMVVYGIISHYLKPGIQRTSALIFFLVVSGGLGGILYIVSTSLGILPYSQAIHLLSNGGLQAAFFQYRTASFAFGLLAVLAFLKKRSWMYLPLGISIVIYPIYGIPFASIFIAHFLLRRQWKPTIEAILLTAAFLLPWAVFFLDSSFASHGFYKGFITNPDYVNPVVFLVWGVFLLPLAAYFFHNYIRRKEKCWDVTFLLVWTIILVALTVFPPVLPLHSQRFLGIVWLPLSISAAMGFFELFMIKQIKSRAVLKQAIVIILIIVLTLPTIGMYISENATPSPRNFIKSSHVDAMYFLRQEPAGLLLTEPNIGLRIPYYAHKRSLEISSPWLLGYDIEGVYESVVSSDANEDEKLEILNNFNVSYLMLVNSTSFSLEGFNTIYKKDDVTVLARDR